MLPSLIVPLGNFACRAVFGEGFDLELRHGIPTETVFGIPGFPHYHPSLGLHEPKKMLYIRTDWDRLRRYLRGALVLPSDDYAGHEDYTEVTDARDLDIDPDLPLACDTESSPSVGPFCLTYSQYPGAGRLVRATHAHLLALLQSAFRAHRSAILFHNYLYDWSVVESMGLSIPVRRVVDTMAEVYRLGNLPQGLKALAFRELGMTMEDFEDVVRPYSTARVLEYYELASLETWPKPDPQMVLDEKGQWKVYKPQGLNTKLKRFFTDYRKSPDTKDIFKQWDNWSESHAMIEAELGPWPGMDIAHVPFDEVLFYAVRDADATGRLWSLIQPMRTVVRRLGQEKWVDYARESVA